MGGSVHGLKMEIDGPKRSSRTPTWAQRRWLDNEDWRPKKIFTRVSVTPLAEGRT